MNEPPVQMLPKQQPQAQLPPPAPKKGRVGVFVGLMRWLLEDGDEKDYYALLMIALMLIGVFFACAFIAFFG